MAAAKLGFRPIARDLTGRELGVFSSPEGERALVVAAGVSPGSCIWALLDASMPKMAYQLTRETYDALRGGTLSTDGALVFQGDRCRLLASFDGIAELVREQTAA